MFKLTIEHTPQIPHLRRRSKRRLAGVQSSRARPAASRGSQRGSQPCRIDGLVGGQHHYVAPGDRCEQQLFDFGKLPLEVKAARKSLEASAHDAAGNRARPRFSSATKAYYTYLLSRQILSVNEEALRPGAVASGAGQDFCTKSASRPSIRLSKPTSTSPTARST